jgi:hypothetical protein
MGFRINGGVRDYARVPIFLMPDAAVRADHRTITGGSMPLLSPRIEERHQFTPQPSNEAGQSRGQRGQAPFPRPACGEPAVFGQQRTQLDHDGIVLVQKGQQSPRGVQPPNRS